jgi:hypothetical protein
METFDFEFGDCSNAMTEEEAADMTTIIDMCRTSPAWRKYIQGSLKAVVLHHPKNRCGHEGSDGPSEDPWLHVVFSNEHKQLWMDGTHSFHELARFSAEIGLDGLKAMDVRVGLTSMKNKGRGRGLHTKE